MCIVHCHSEEQNTVTVISKDVIIRNISVRHPSGMEEVKMYMQQ